MGEGQCRQLRGRQARTKGNVWLCLFLVCLSVSCNDIDKGIEETLAAASKVQRQELEEFLSRYTETSQKKAARYLVANMLFKHSVEGFNSSSYQVYLDSVYDGRKGVNNYVGYDYRTTSDGFQKRMDTDTEDIDSMEADSLVRHVNSVFSLWNRSPWHKLYDDETFARYVLPYRIADEPVEYDWFEKAYLANKRWIEDYKDSTLISACHHVYKHIDYRTNNLFWGEPLQRYSDNVKYKQGTCSDQAVYTAMIMRALGMPTAIDFVPYWGNSNNGHAFNALLLPDGTCMGYNGEKDFKEGLALSSMVPKIYRKTYELQRDTPLYKYKDSEYIPSVFARHDVSDVTLQYDIPTSDVTVSCEKQEDISSHIAYLSVFSPQGWLPVAWAEAKGKTIDFKNMGVGYMHDASPDTFGEDCGSGCLYLPVCFPDESPVPIASPFILEKGEQVRNLTPNLKETETIVLHRKYPRKARIIDFARKMRGGYFEVANRADFSDSELACLVKDTPKSGVQTQDVSLTKKYRYIRFFKKSGGLSIGELECRDGKGNLLQGKPIADEFLQDDADIGNINDGNVLSYYDIGNIKNVWVGLDFGRPVDIATLSFSPRTDDNEVSRGDSYELFCWNNDGWQSLGKKIADSDTLAYENVPRNSLLWLRDLTKGKEERPFTYENGKQIWR